MRTGIDILKVLDWNECRARSRGCSSFHLVTPRSFLALCSVPSDPLIALVHLLIARYIDESVIVKHNCLYYDNKT